MNYKQLLFGLMTHIPGVFGLFSNTGGTSSARYCYSVWLRHLVMGRESGLLAGLPRDVAELGPGDSLGIGLAALISGVETYHAFDVVAFSDASRNMAIFDELVQLFQSRPPIELTQGYSRLTGPRARCWGLAGRGIASRSFLANSKVLEYNRVMQLTAKVKLQVTPKQAATLKRTLQAANECCNWLSDMAWNTKKFGQFTLHKIAYHPARAQFPGLNSSVIVRCEAKVSQSYALDKKTKRTFKPLGAIEYDHNILSWFVNQHQVSIWTVDGRLHLTFTGGSRQLELLQGKIGQADLALVGKNFYLCAPCTVENPEPQDVADVLGIDLGIIHIATDSDGQTYSGQAVEDNRRKFAHRRRNLQRKGTQAAKRKLKHLSGKQARFQCNTNHIISKTVVQKAQATGRGISLEDLTGIRDRATTRRRQRARHANWSFYDLRAKIEYKAQRVGVPVFLVDPRNTSRLCPKCGCIDKANRKSQSSFSCVSCGYADSADHNASVNIADRANVTRPNGRANLAPTSSPLLAGST